MGENTKEKFSESRKDLIKKVKEIGVKKVWEAAKDQGFKVSLQTVYHFTWNKNVRIATIEQIEMVVNKLQEPHDKIS